MHHSNTFRVMTALVTVACSATASPGGTVWSDDFEDGTIDPSLWAWGGHDDRGVGGGSWQFSHEEIIDTDGYLQIRIWGPTSGLSHGAEGWVRTTYDYNDGSDCTINFRWATDVNASHIDMYAIQITDGSIPGGTDLFWYGGSEGEIDGSGWTNLYFGWHQTDMPPMDWSIHINGATDTATLYDGPNLTGQILGQKTLPSNQAWYVRFILSDATSAGFPAGDNVLDLYDFSSNPGCVHNITQDEFYATIQGGIDDADNSDEIVVCPGTYNETVNFNGKAITLRSSDGPDLTIIDGTGLNDSVVKCVTTEGLGTVLDGFTITGGSGSSGGGMYNENSSPSVRNCWLIANAANAVDAGAGMKNQNSSPRITNCVFSENLGTGGGGGGMTNVGNSNPIVTDCTFSQNVARDGGGMFNKNSDPLVVNCTFIDNLATGGTNRYGGGMRNNNSDARLVNCTFIENAADDRGGAIYNDSSDVTIIQCTFVRNEANGTFGGGAIFNEQSAPYAINCHFLGNFAADDGGAIYNYDGSNARIVNCAFSGNSTGGQYLPSQGGAIFNWLSSPSITSCTFGKNEAVSDGGGLHSGSGSTPVLTNCILWENQDAGGMDETAQISVDFGGQFVVRYTCVQGLVASGPYDDGTNIDADPMFVRDPDPGPDGEWDGVDDDYGDLRLTFGSPCIDAGDNMAFLTEAVVLGGLGGDLDGNGRFVDDPPTSDTGIGLGAIIDMGAYEFNGVPGDFDKDGNVDLYDFAQFMLGFGGP